MIVFYYNNMILGGAELLIVRIARKLQQYGNDAIVISKSISKDILKELTHNKINYYICKSPDIKIISMINKNHSTLIVTFFYIDYIHIKYIMRNLKNAQILLYCVHCQGMIFGRPIPHIMKNVFMKHSKSFIESGIKNKSIWLMDKETIDRTKKYYMLDKKIKIMPVGLPYDYDKTEGNIKELIQQKIDRNTLKIISVARADFPFKGYIIDLIEQFAEYNTKYPNSELHIVSSGKGENFIINKIKEQKTNVQACIIFHGKMYPEELKKLLSKMHILIGMGTTMLDASSEGVIALPVVPTTMKCLCAENFFSENLLFSVLPNEGSKNLFSILEKVQKMSDMEFMEYSFNSYYIGKNYFSTEKIVNNLLKCSIDNNGLEHIRIMERYLFLDRLWKKIKILKFESQI